ncbi:kynureninase [Elongatibacter sediminis]|uniref:Kynureninase n=1 Tax=Elongatibacter sediminis TaxID=3119006 RepID=A0AAW9R7M9_9GAMM
MNPSDPTQHLLAAARERDAADPLRHFRSGFSIPRHTDGSDTLYFTGNSLGLLHQASEAALGEVMQAWKERGVEGHFTGERPWTRYHELLREGLAELTGAEPGEVIAMNTLTVNLHLGMVSFYRPEGRRTRIVIEKQAFPSDRYAVESQIRFHGLDPDECLVELESADGRRLLDETDIEDYLERSGDTVALVLWPGVQYATGQVFDLPRIAAASRAAGARVGFDLAHAIGNVPVALGESDCDFAAWCTYKYLNAGPGAIAGMYVNKRYDRRTDLPRFNGWFGNDLATRFRMAPEFDPAPGVEAWVLSTPPTLAIAPLLGSLQVFAEAGLDRLRAKSLDMTGWLAAAIQRELDDVLEIITPLEDDRRGCQLSLRVRAGRDAGRALFECLEHSGALPDWREPDVIRVAPVPLYNRYEDCARLVALIRTWADRKN